MLGRLVLALRRAGGGDLQSHGPMLEAPRCNGRQLGLSQLVHVVLSSIPTMGGQQLVLQPVHRAA